MQFNIKNFDAQYYEELKVIAKEKDISVNELVRIVLENYIADRVISSSLNRFEMALRNTQECLDNNTAAFNHMAKYYKKFNEDNLNFRGFLIDLMTNDELEVNEENQIIN